MRATVVPKAGKFGRLIDQNLFPEKDLVGNNIVIKFIENSPKGWLQAAAKMTTHIAAVEHAGDFDVRKPRLLSQDPNLSPLSQSNQIKRKLAAAAAKQEKNREKLSKEKEEKKTPETGATFTGGFKGLLQQIAQQAQPTTV